MVVDGWESPAYWRAMLHAKLTQHAGGWTLSKHAADPSIQAGPVAWARRAFLRSCSLVVTAGSASTEAAVAAGASAARIAEAFNPVDGETISIIARDARLRAERSENGGHNFVIIGQLIERKNISNAIDAFALVVWAGRLAHHHRFRPTRGIAARACSRSSSRSADRVRRPAHA